MRIAIGCDHAGFRLKLEIVQWLKNQPAGHGIEDYGSHSEEPCDYPDIAVPLAHAVAKGYHDRGILVCGTGVGMAIAANRIHGVRAVNCSENFSARSSREHNNANILTLGERVLEVAPALEIVKLWLQTPFSGEPRHERRLEKIEELAAEFAALEMRGGPG